MILLGAAVDATSLVLMMLLGAAVDATSLVLMILLGAAVDAISITTCEHFTNVTSHYDDDSIDKHLAAE